MIYLSKDAFKIHDVAIIFVHLVRQVLELLGQLSVADGSDGLLLPNVT